MRDSEQRFRSLVETTSDWVWEVDRDAVYTYVSPRIKDLLGYEPEEVLGQRPFDLMPPDEAQRVAAAFQRVVESREPFAPLENTNVHRDGHHVVLESSGVPIVNASGELVGYRGIDRDITQRKRAENELARTLQELERSNADLQQFAGAASHDLQEPLRAIRGFAQLLQRHCAGRTDAKADEYLQFIVHGAGRMQQLINDLLAYARLGMGGKKIEPVDCNEVVAEALTNLKGALTDQDAEVTCQQLPTVAADRTRLVQLFQNLISNAIKFRGDQPPRVQISAVQSQSEWVFSVCDHGIGIALEHTERIFVVFQRLHHQSQYPGTGIGLAICKRIVEGNKGRIWCESELGHGATFRFTLPVSASST
ncbi:MAG: hypothetical protein A2W31_03465 [Planctomycetes bacterium RBG_16_64_10]|nr:MAG: hypothetical protein A2W31_03465 [Planctomycetes bacterium RBG_16_64_10]